MITNIASEQVRAVFMDCLYKDKELTPGVRPDAIIADGIAQRVGFHPQRLEEKRSIVIAWLNVLPHQFHKGEGDGWSFLNACNQEDGYQWTGLHQSMEQLFCLGIGLALVKPLLPRSVWSALPGGMPYYQIDLNGQRISKKGESK